MPLAVYIPSEIGEGYFTDWPAAQASDDGKVRVWNNSAGEYQPTTSLSNFTLVTPTIASFANATHTHQNSAGGGQLDHGAALTGLSDDDHTQYLLATGSRTGASSQAQTFTNGILVPVGSAANPIIAITTDTDTGIFSSGANNLSFSTGGTERLRINQSGSVDIGGTTFGARLCVEGGNVLIDNNRGYQIKDNAGNSITAITMTTANNFQYTNSAATGNMQFQITNATGEIEFRTNSTNRVRVSADGYSGFGNISTPTAIIDIVGSTTTAASLRIRSGTAPTSPNDGDMWKNTDEFVMFASGSNTNTVLNALRLRRNASGTPAAGYGSALNFQLKSSTTAGRDAGRIIYKWDTSTDATRASIGQATSFYTTTENPSVTWGSNSSGALLSFYDVTTPVARQVLATGAGRTVDDVITALQTLGLVKQS